MNIEGNQSTAEFDEFVASGEVEVGKSVPTADDDGGEDEKGKKGGGSGRPPKPAKEIATNTDEDEGGDDEGGDDEGGDEEGGDDGKPKKTAKDHQIERLKREKRELQRLLHEGGGSELARRLEAIESRLTGEKGGDNKNAGKPAPDPSDTEKYPLGHLDDRYIEDKLEWLADRKAAEQADAILGRNQEQERDEAIRQHQTALLEKVEDLSIKGTELFDDFQEEVVEAGMRGDWKLQQPTFEACHEAENGAQILYELSQDPKEALRVSRLSPYQQLKFVQERDTAIATGKKGRTKPKAGEPPQNVPRGANSKTQINPATENLEDFGKLWEADAKKNG